MPRGSIRQRSKGSWTFRYDLPRGADGKRRVKQVTVRGTKRETEAVMVQTLANLGKSESEKASERSIRETYQDFLKERAGKNLRPGNLRHSTVDRYNNVFKNYILPECGEKPLAEVDRDTLQRVIEHMVDAGLAPGTIKVNTHYLKGFFSWAVRAERLVESPARKLTLPEVSRTSTAEILSAEEVREVLNLLEDTPYWLPSFLGLYTGMRPGEVLGLCWEDVDFLKGRILVRHTLNPAGGSFFLGPPKTKTSERSIAVSPEVMRVLRDYQKRMPDAFWYETTATVGNRLKRVRVPVEFRQVCAQADGRIVKAKAWGDAFRSKMRGPGLKPIRLHDLRHTHASLLLLDNVPMHVVSRRLGHSNIQTTINAYGHLLPNSDQEAAARFEGIIDAEL